jgi:aminoglycoside phosphotransferase (APT) family kinase protein
VIATAAPSAANRTAIAFPSPLLPPVTSATFPSHAEAMSGNTIHMAAIDLPTPELEKRLKPLEVHDIQRLPGGASSLTYTGRTSGGGHVVVKVAPAGIPPLLNRDVLRQARLLRALASTAVPVPEVLWTDPGEPPEVPPLFVMSFVEGSSLEPLYDLDGDDDPTTVGRRLRHAVSVMADLHALEPEIIGLGDEPVVGPREEVERWCRLLETIERSVVPSWNNVAADLRATQPPALAGAVVHGDFRLGNMLASGGTITAVIDWEIWTVGDPRVDLGWFLVNADPDTYRRPTRYAGTLPSLSELAAIYGDVPDLAWFKALACFKSAATWALIVKHNRRRSDPDPGVEAVAADLPRLLDRARAELAG